MTTDSVQPPSQPDLYLADGELREFSSWLSLLLDKLNGSGVSGEQVSVLNTAEHHFGESPAAAEIFAEYERVRARLEEFVRLQQEAIEMLSISTAAMENDYVTADQEEFERFQQISANFDSLYDRGRGSGSGPGDVLL
ncbi:hypothetical protein [Streptomyces sp. PT12]|uniref:hypothetical protein n=1 Tax=Streptomyces sp. PT12 TaxID=1510197 RepID=UPI000DE1E56A|nr:hypothetical protein [Streptomyces sp. PT12]RBM05082.1 hypothetical protein DEH69_28960 [Streptomyces sp. PT12]